MGSSSLKRGLSIQVPGSGRSYASTVPVTGYPSFLLGDLHSRCASRANRTGMEMIVTYGVSDDGP
jgi:hypothetical protein